jgi:hypothetical protein
MQNPYNERFEAIEADIISTKESIKKLSNLMLRLSDKLLNDERRIAETLLRIHLLWALVYLIRLKDKPATQVQAQSCIQKARESARTTLTEISYIAEPFDSFARWYSNCSSYFYENGLTDVFPEC